MNLFHTLQEAVTPEIIKKQNSISLDSCQIAYFLPFSHGVIVLLTPFTWLTTLVKP